MKKFILFLCLFTAISVSALAQTVGCNPSMTLTNGNTMVTLNTWQRADGYYFDIIGENLVNISAGCYVYINGNEQFQLIKAPIATSNTLITIGPIESTTLPKFYTPLYVLMPHEVVFGSVNAAILPYCQDGPMPTPKSLTHNLKEDYLCKGSSVTFTATGFEDEPLVWQMGESAAGPWTTLNYTEPTVTFTDLTVGTYFFKVSQGKYNATASLVVGICCDVTGSQQKVIWQETFEPSDDPTPDVEGTKKRYHNKYVGNTYSFAAFNNTCAGVEGKGKICDGYYAVVTKSDDANPAMCAWPVGKYDHTTGNGSSGFLIVNAGEADAIIYEQEITPEGGFCTTGMWYNFSLYATNIAPTTADPAKFILEIIEIQSDGTQEILAQWNTGEIEGSLMQNWYRYGTSFAPSDKVEKIIVRVWNAGKSNNGNDLVMDDLQVSICQPSAELFVGDVTENQKVSTDKDCGNVEILTAILSGKESDFFPEGAYYLWLQSVDNGKTFTEIATLSGVGQSAVEYVTTYAANPIQIYAIIASSRQSALDIKNGNLLTNACATYAITDKVKVSCVGDPTCLVPPVLTFNPINPICFGTTEPVELIAVATPSSATQTIVYSGEYVSGNKFEASKAPIGSYPITANLTDGLCTATASIMIDVVDNPTVSIVADVNELTCDQPQANLLAVSEQTVQYTWNTMHTTEAINVTEAGTYVVTATDNNGCSAQAETVITDNVEYLEGKLVVTPTDVLVGELVQLQFEVTAGKANQIQWYWSNKEIALNSENVDFPMMDGEYQVVAVSNCNTVVDTVQVTVAWPTVITPYNIDGYNDDFVGNIQMSLPIKIFTRFGSVIYEGNQGWDGSLSNGKMAMPGVYYYSIELPNGTLKTGSIEVYKD